MLGPFGMLILLRISDHEVQTICPASFKFDVELEIEYFQALKMDMMTESREDQGLSVCKDQPPLPQWLVKGRT